MWRDKRFKRYLTMMSDLLGTTFVDKKTGAKSYNFTCELYDMLVENFKAMSEDEKNDYNF